MITLIIIVAVVVVLVLWAVFLYNRLVRLRVEVQQGWSNIDVQLRRRYDLIPNLIESVKGYAAHERGVFQAVTEARTGAMSAHGPAATGMANNALASALGGLFAVAENYPDLKAYNATQTTVPSVVVAKVGDFALAEFFEEENEAARTAPRVSFDQ